MYRKTSARVVGALFLTATAAGVLSMVLLGPLDTLSSPRAVAHEANRISAGALMVLVMAAAVALIPPTLFPVLKQHGEAPALGYVVARIVEAVLLLPGAIVPLMVVAVGTSRSPAGTSGDPAPLDTVAVLFRTQGTWLYAVHSVFFCLSVLLLNYLLYRSRLVPRWIAGWALVAVVPYLADACLVMFDALTLSSPIHALLVFPLGLNEMVLAGWLLTKGFRAPPTSQLAEARPNSPAVVSSA